MSGHQKRVAAPKSWRIERKKHKWVVNPRPGPHPKDKSIPLLLIVRDILKLADNTREARRILKQGHILVNGKVRKDHRFPVGLFDIISIPLMDQHYRLLIDDKSKLSLTRIKKEDAATKLCRVNNKRYVKGGRIQLNMHDGRNILSDIDVKTYDSVVLKLDTNEIVDVFRRKKGSKAIVIGGRHSGELGEIEEVKEVRSSQPNKVILKNLENGEIFETIEDYIFVVGEEKVELDLEGLR
ncbi:MAG TPA: 30S ribosomal protein S4e [Candidatus Syntrophoarchaeum butanivorans]|uniref:Small ribosomal subunit protein eS4 n=1 Tax=Candidatus Syntropharchaeum butanivorans TaxID=1839936 RepID=A0A1F2P6W9_9EURY|nr:MAG: 30S ribosomal protein S4e [Candidatus Syntrophoarchaeum butanivorans]RJS72500.1 MAG: 30S ribosomal protein S4e [Candidatus Syntrophoarchaeum sp. WYZ-LMO15]HDM35709.1 30S ribosomal protein S4e [Candidatus Syntrophoarchaeum butanivorans]HEC56714.1 30S ribosomal protein S4e [Candidatus Syntrophoarchaeum butanivorans]